MAEVDTSIYKNLIGNQKDPIKEAAGIMGLVGSMNQNKLFEQTYGARERIGDAYKRNVGPDGKINYPGLSRDIGQGGGFLAGEALGTAGTNATNQFALDSAQTKYVQQSLSALASMKDLTPAHVARWATQASRNGVSQDIISGILDSVYSESGKRDPKALRNALIRQGALSLGTGALEETEGPPTGEGAGTKITKGRKMELIAPGGASAPAAPGQPAQEGMVSTNPPGFEKVAGAGADAYNSAVARSGRYAADIFPLKKALEGVIKLGPEGMGPGADEMNTLKSFLLTNKKYIPGADDIDPEKISTFEQTKKYMVNLAGDNAARFGHGTDQALSTALAASPNVKLSQLAAKDLLIANIALRRMSQVQDLQAVELGFDKAPAKYGPWAAKWANNVDPRAFMIDEMDDVQKKRLFESIKTPAQKEKFNRSVKMAIEAGVMEPPGQQ